MSADFYVWSKESLVMFAKDAAERMQQQQAEIEALQADLRAALDAYRRAVTSAASPQQRPG